MRDTIPSPKQWGYRTKITPHFDAPPKTIQREMGQSRQEDEAKKGIASLSHLDGRNGVPNGVEEDALNGIVSGAGSSDGDLLKTRTTEQRNSPKPSHVLQQNGCDTKQQDESSSRGLFECRIGFDKKGLPGILDIEVCIVVVC